MDFIVGLPKTLKGYTVIWVVVDRLTKSAHFLSGKATYTVDNWAQLYVKEIVRLHRVPMSIVLDWDPRFTSAFWPGLRKAMGTRLVFSTACCFSTISKDNRQVKSFLVRGNRLTGSCWKKIKMRKIRERELLKTFA